MYVTIKDEFRKLCVFLLEYAFPVVLLVLNLGCPAVGELHLVEGMLCGMCRFTFAHFALSIAGALRCANRNAWSSVHGLSHADATGFSNSRILLVQQFEGDI
jgi:hypothetical protein